MDINQYLVAAIMLGIAAIIGLLVRLYDSPVTSVGKAKEEALVLGYVYAYIAAFVAWMGLGQPDLTLYANWATFIVIAGAAVSGMAFIRSAVNVASSILTPTAAAAPKPVAVAQPAALANEPVVTATAVKKTVVKVVPQKTIISPAPKVAEKTIISPKEPPALAKKP